MAERRRGGESIEAILTRWLRAQRGPARALSAADRWAEVAGSAIASQTRLLDLSAGVLTVEVSSPALLQELSTYFSRDLVEALGQHEEFRGLREIRFKAGSF